MRAFVVAAAAAAAALAVLCACPADDGAGPGGGEGEGEGDGNDGSPVGAACETDEECASSSCIEVCRCDDDGECDGNADGAVCGPGGLCGPCFDNDDCGGAGFVCGNVVGGLGEFACFTIGCIEDVDCGNDVCERACDSHTLRCVPPAAAGETCSADEQFVCEGYTRSCAAGLQCSAACADPVAAECSACGP